MTRKQRITLAVLASASGGTLVLANTFLPSLGIVADLLFVGFTVAFSFLAGASYQRAGTVIEQAHELVSATVPRARHVADEERVMADWERHIRTAQDVADQVGHSVTVSLADGSIR